jgi:peptide/nickel transport system substrate-binding protein
LKKDIFWHDEERFTADDVIFTIEIIQDLEYKSPLKGNWQGVEVEKIDDTTVRFKLETTYAPFLNNLTVGIIPKHIWEYFEPVNFLLAERMLKPIGTGPYEFEEFTKDKDGKIKLFSLSVNERYYGKAPFIEKISFKFFQNEIAAIEAYNKKEVMGINYLSAANIEKIRNKENLNLYPLSIPRYFAVFFNQNKSKVLSDKTVRLALAYATDKNEIIEKVLFGQGNKVETPILPHLLGYNPETKIYDFALEHANNILEEDGWKYSEEENGGVRKKGDLLLEFTIITTDWPELIETAEFLKEQWGKVGARINIETSPISEIQQKYIRPREYEALLFGEVLGGDPDPYAFWHSSQKKDPGLNLALYISDEADKLLEEARVNLDSNIRAEKYRKFQEIVVEDIPAIFLYSPTYLYAVNKKVQGIEIENVVLPSKRFSEIENWHIKTKKVWR